MVVLRHPFVIPVIVGRPPWLSLVIPCRLLLSPPQLAPAIHPTSSGSWVWVWVLVVRCVVPFDIIVGPWCLSMSSSYGPGDLQCHQGPISTCDPPCEQLLAGMGAGAGSSVVVGVCYGCSSCSGSPGTGRPHHHCRRLDTLAIHPTSSCLQAWGRVLGRPSWGSCGAGSCHQLHARTRNPSYEQWLAGMGQVHCWFWVFIGVGGVSDVAQVERSGGAYQVHIPPCGSPSVPLRPPNTS
jgi:hypothetical protein